RPEARRGLFKKIEDIFLRQAQQSTPPVCFGALLCALLLLGHCAPEVIEQTLAMLAPLLLASLLGAQVYRPFARIAVYTLILQSMGGVKKTLDLGDTVTLFALRDVALGESQVIENAVSVGPLLKDVIVLEKVVVTEGCVRDHQRLHGGGIFF